MDNWDKEINVLNERIKSWESKSSGITLWLEICRDIYRKFSERYGPTKNNFIVFLERYIHISDRKLKYSIRDIIGIQDVFDRKGWKLEKASWFEGFAKLKVKDQTHALTIYDENALEECWRRIIESSKKQKKEVTKGIIQEVITEYCKEEKDSIIPTAFTLTTTFIPQKVEPISSASVIHNTVDTTNTVSDKKFDEDKLRNNIIKIFHNKHKIVKDFIDNRNNNVSFDDIRNVQGQFLSEMKLRQLPVTINKEETNRDRFALLVSYSDTDDFSIVDNLHHLLSQQLVGKDAFKCRVLKNPTNDELIYHMLGHFTSTSKKVGFFYFYTTRADSFIQDEINFTTILATATLSYSKESIDTINMIMLDCYMPLSIVNMLTNYRKFFYFVLHDIPGSQHNLDSDNNIYGFLTKAFQRYLSDNSCVKKSYFYILLETTKIARHITYFELNPLIIGPPSTSIYDHFCFVNTQLNAKEPNSNGISPSEFISGLKKYDASLQNLEVDLRTQLFNETPIGKMITELVSKICVVNNSQ